MPKFLTQFTFLFIVIVIIHGCRVQAPIQRFPDITFSHLQAYKINVAEIKVENRFREPLIPPHIEHLLPMSPSTAAEQWLRDRFHPIGLSGSLHFVIEDARATATSLDLDKSFKGQFTKQQSQLYQMTIQARLHLKDTNGNILGTATARAERSITAREDISINDRNNIWLEAVNGLMHDFNLSIEPNIESYLGQWLN